VAILKEFSYVTGVGSSHRIYKDAFLKSGTSHAIKEYINIGVTVYTFCWLSLFMWNMQNV
jgi:hypothetical protein